MTIPTYPHITIIINIDILLANGSMADTKCIMDVVKPMKNLMTHDQPLMVL